MVTMLIERMIDGKGNHAHINLNADVITSIKIFTKCMHIYNHNKLSLKS